MGARDCFDRVLSLSPRRFWSRWLEHYDVVLRVERGTRGGWGRIRVRIEWDTGKSGTWSIGWASTMGIPICREVRSRCVIRVVKRVGGGRRGVGGRER